MSLLASRKKSEESPAVPDSTTKDRRFSPFNVGDDVYRLEGEQYVLGTITKVDLDAEKYVVKFGDGTEKLSSVQDLKKFNESTSHCVICKKSKTKTDNEIIECDKCGRGYHQLCHQPHAPADSDSGVRWLCIRCSQRVPNKSREAKALKKDIKESTRKISRILTEAKLSKQLVQANKEMLSLPIKHNNPPGTKQDWAGHRATQFQIKGPTCYCRRKAEKFLKMLQCQLCKQWFHEKCLQCLTHPVYSGDRFYVFVCKLCNYGKEFVRRLELKWENIVHLAIFNLSILHGKKYYDLETTIIPYINANWNEFQLPLKILNCSLEERKVHIRSVLTKNTHQFKCGKEIKKRTTIWALRQDVPPVLPEITLPKNVPISDALLKDSNKSLKFLPPTFKALATGKSFDISGKSYLFNGQRDNVTLPSMIHMMAMESNGLSSSCSSDNDSKAQISKNSLLSMPRDSLSITSSKFYSCGFVKKSTPFPSVNPSLQNSAAQRRWKAGNGTDGSSNNMKRRKMKRKGNGPDKDFASRKARKLVKNAIARPKKSKKSHKDQDLPPTPPSSSAPDTPQPSSSPPVSTPLFNLGQPSGDTSGDDNSSRCTLDSFIPPPKDFEGKNNPFCNLTELLSSTNGLSVTSTFFSSTTTVINTSPITLPLPLTAIVQHPSPQRATKRQLCEKDIRIDRNGDVKRRRLRRTRSSSTLTTTVVTGTASKTATIVPIRPGEKPGEVWNANISGRSLRSTYNNSTPSTSSSVSVGQITNTVDYVLNGRQLRASPRLSSDKKLGPSMTQSPSAKSSPVKQSPVPISLDDLKSSVNIYFGAANRIATGEKYNIQAKRVLPSGKVQYLIEWEGPST